MDILMIILRILHIFSGVFWVGATFFNLGFLQPTVRATGGEGQKVMQHLTMHTGFTSSIYGSASLSLLTGLLMYWRLFGFRASALSSPYGLTLALGGLAGAIAWAVAIFVVRGIFTRMQAVGQAVQAQGGPPTPEQAAELGALSTRLVNLGQWGAALMVIALLAMSVAQYVNF